MDIGIDLGTTFSVIAVDGNVTLAADYAPGIYMEEIGVTIIPSPDGSETFPSVMAVDPEHPDQYLFGNEAVAQSEVGQAPVMFSKRRIGTDEAIPLGEDTIMARDFAREFLKYLKACAEKALGQRVHRAVVTHPAYFDRGAVEETREAAREAGFDMSLPEQMLMEPTAAALAYTRTDKRDPLSILTYDLGGGTFDVTYMERRGGVLDIRAFDGNHLLGGYNFDRELVHWVRKKLEAGGRKIEYDEGDPDDRARLARLLQLAEKVKIALANAKTDQAKVEFRGRDVAIDSKGKNVLINESITREEFVKLIQPHLEGTLDGCRRALKKAGVAPDDVDEVLLVGGSTYGPWVSACVAAVFTKATPKLFRPDLCVGAGAAIHAKMALPQLAGDGDYKLTVDAPERAVQEAVQVAGQVTANGKPCAEAVCVLLERVPPDPDDTVLAPATLNPDGRFLFEEIELKGEHANAFRIRVCRTGTQESVIEHAFSIQYAPHAAETSGVRTVLPKPLYIETFEGLVPLAEEGAVLPALVRQSFVRLNDNASIELQLYQKNDPIGVVRIEDIPEGGRGATVDLEVEVTAENQIRGTASVRGKDGSILAKMNVSVSFKMPEIPGEYELREECEALADACEQAQSDEERAELVQTQALPLLNGARRLLEQQPLERPEVYVLLRRLRATLFPPQDDMRPSRDQFLNSIKRCREAIEKARNPGAEASPAIAAKAARLEPMLAVLEKEGFDAHDRRDRKAWADACEKAGSMHAQLQEPGVKPKVELPPTQVLKRHAFFELIRAIKELKDQSDAQLAKGRLEDKKREIDTILAEMSDVGAEIMGVDETLPNTQAHAQLQLMLNLKVNPLKKRIEQLGVDIGKRPGY